MFFNIRVAMMRGHAMGGPNYAERYANLRALRGVFAERRISGVEKSIDEVNSSLSDKAHLLQLGIQLIPKARQALEREMEGLRVQKNDLLAEKKRLRNIVFWHSSFRETFLKEFHNICRIPSVHSVRVIRKKLIFKVDARFELDGVRYHLGDWSVELNLSTDEFSQKRINSGLTHEAEMDSSTQGSQYSWDFGFCFGSNKKLLLLLIEQGDYVTAIRTAVAYMNDVNPEHRSLVQEFYREVV